MPFSYEKWLPKQVTQQQWDPNLNNTTNNNGSEYVSITQFYFQNYNLAFQGDILPLTPYGVFNPSIECPAELPRKSIEPTPSSYRVGIDCGAAKFDR